MKASNYITISFFVFLFGGILALFISAKNNSKESNHLKLFALEKPLDSFSVVVAQAGANIQLTKGPALKIMKFYQEGDTCTLPPFVVRNDTLFVQENSINDQLPPVQIFYDQINGVKGEERSQIHLYLFTTDTFDITVGGGKLFCYAGNVKMVNKKVIIHATKGSYLQMDQLNIQHMELQLDGSELNLQNTNIGQLSGILKNRSKFNNYTSIYKMNLEVDTTSTYFMSKQ